MQSFPWERPIPYDIDISLLNIDTTYQSTVPRNPRLVREIGANFDIGLFGRLRVARRTYDGNRLFVYDGRHRFEGAQLAGRQHIPCDVYDVATRQREVELFVDSNTRGRKVPQSMIFTAELAAGNEDATALSHLVQDAGLVIVDSASAKQEFATPKLSCIAALKSLYGHGPKSYARRATPVDHAKLSEALNIIASIAPPDALVTEHMVLGMVWLTQNYPNVRMHADRLAKLGWPRLDMAARAVGPRPVMAKAGEALLSVIDYKRAKAARLAPDAILPPPPDYLPSPAG